MNSPSASPITFTNARMVLADEVVMGSVHCQSGLITAVDLGSSMVAGAIDLQG